MKTFTLLILALSIGLLGCQTKPATVPASENVAQTTQSKGASSEGGDIKAASPKTSSEKISEKKKESTKPKSGITSIYTDLDEKKCKTIEKNEEEGWIVQECAGVGGYKLQVAEGDIRQTINVISPANKKSELNLWSVVSPAFSSVGQKAEWRVKTVEGKPVPFALIVRYNASKEAPEKTTSYLTVTKIDGDKSCVTDVVKPIKNANVKARELADVSADKPCKK